MSLIICVTNDNKLYVGADRRCTNESNKTYCDNIIKLIKINNNILIGYVGRQLLYNTDFLQYISEKFRNEKNFHNIITYIKKNLENLELTFPYTTISLFSKDKYNKLFIVNIYFVNIFEESKKFGYGIQLNNKDLLSIKCDINEKNDKYYYVLGGQYDYKTTKILKDKLDSFKEKYTDQNIKFCIEETFNCVTTNIKSDEKTGKDITISKMFEYFVI